MNLTKYKWKLNFSQCFDQGGRNYMEDFCYSHIERSGNDALFGIFGIFDGHGGAEAAQYAQKTLKDELVKIDKFWSNDNFEVAESIKLVYLKLQKLMWIERENWVRTISGYKSTAGTTASIIIIRNGVLYTGHVGDSGILLLYLDDNNVLQSQELTNEHKPDNPIERKRIEDCGGSLKRKAGIDRVVWNRKRLHTNSDEIDRIPFLAVARSLGDLWSYDVERDCYHVSPEPDVKFFHLDAGVHRAIIIASDGLWNVVNRELSEKLIKLCLFLNKNRNIYNPAQLLVNYSLCLWRRKNVKADNISAIVILFQPENGENSTEVIESLDNDIDLLSLHSELISNNILEVSLYNSPCVLLSNISDFNSYKEHYQYIARSQNATDQDMELLQLYLQSDSKFSMCCDPWPDSRNYWDIFTKSFKNLGCVSFPNIISYLETRSKNYVDQLILVLPWSICCLDLIDVMQFTNRIKLFIQNQPISTEFWISLFHNVLKQGNMFMESNVSDVDTMKNILMSKSLEINNWVMSLLTNSPFSVITQSQLNQTKLSFKKSRTYNDSCSINDVLTKQPSSSDISSTPSIYKCLQLKKSASFELSKSNLYYNIQTDIMPVLDSDSTRSLNTSTDCDNIVCESSKEINNLNSIRRHNVPLSLKRKISESVTQLIFIPCEKTNDDQNSKVIKKITLTRKKRFIL